MKTVVMIVQGTTQISLEPENEAEKAALEPIKKHGGPVSILWGSVYECRGGYFRATGIGHRNEGYESLIIRLDSPPPPLDPQPPVFP